MKQFWSKQEEEILKKYYKKHSDFAYVKSLLTERSSSAIRKRISELKLSVPTAKPFTESEILFLLQNYRTHTNRQLADALKRRTTSVRCKLYELGCQRTLSYKELAWGESEDVLLIKHYKYCGDKEIASMLPGRTHKGVRKRRIRLGLIRTLQESIAIYNKNKSKIEATQFKPGRKAGNNNAAKAWDTRRKNLLLTDQQILEIINRRTDKVYTDVRPI